MTQEKRENFMFTNDTIFYKKLWSLMLPMMLQNLMLALVAVADAFMLGGMDQNYMSAVSLATQIQFIQNMLLSAATGGLAILGAQYWGRGNIKTVDDIFCMALRLCGLVSIAFFIACICFPQYLMLFFTDEPVLIGYGVQYLRIAGFSYLLTGISHTINCFIRIHHVNKPVCKNLLNPVAVICSVQYIDIIHMINFNFQNSYFSSLLNIIHNIFFKFDLTIKIRQRINFRNHILIPKQNNKISVFALL